MTNVSKFKVSRNGVSEYSECSELFISMYANHYSGQSLHGCKMESFVTLKEFEDHCRQLVPATTLGYIKGAAALGVTLHENERAFQK